VRASALRAEIEWLDGCGELPRERALAAVDALLLALERGEVRAAEPVADGWNVNDWVKRGILLGFRVGSNAPLEVPPVFHFRDRESFTTWTPNVAGRNIRIVPGGTTIRRGAYLADGVVVMPPAYVNVGAYVGEGSLVDSHALVGSCAQVGRRVHLSAAAQIGGVLEPVGAVPVVIEDEVFIGGGCGIYEGTWVRRGAVLAAGVVLTRSVPIYDLVRETVVRAAVGEPLVVPEGAVLVPGARPAAGAFAATHRLQLHTPVIVKYRDRSTDAAALLEDLLR
jgi:2,3,4,5-tetrahydropyridine-2-carboxylate N-succinyltransferase